MKAIRIGRTPLAAALSGAFALLAASSAGAGTIVGSAHDFSVQTWALGQICIACHTPHKSDTTVTDAPLWNHALTTATYTLYSSATLNAVPGQPAGVSKLCLSCHDGTVALDSFGGRTGTTKFAAGSPRNLGTDLSNDHPISFLFDAALATADGALADPTATTVTIGDAPTRTGTVNALMLGGTGKMECSSCHDVHNTFAVAGTKLLKVNTAASQICLTCHKK
jgi:predicted CXXCH cytochrome family protein